MSIATEAAAASLAAIARRARPIAEWSMFMPMAMAIAAMTHTT
jgi:hypothetical protein